MTTPNTILIGLLNKVSEDMTIKGKLTDEDIKAFQHLSLLLTEENNKLPK